MNRSGLAMIVVIMSLSAFMIISLTLYQTALLLPRFAHEKIKQESNDQLLDGALVYAVAFCRENWHHLLLQARQGKKEEIFSIQLPDNISTAIITITLGIKQQEIHVAVIKNNKKVATRKTLMHNDLTITHL